MSSDVNKDSFVQEQRSIGEQDRKHPISPTNEEEINEIVYALSNFKGVGQHQLSFGKGAAIRILEKPDDNWWWGEIDGVKGYIPVNHLTYESVQQMYWEDNEYFGNYGNLKIHHEMLSDRPRTLAYQSAIQKNAQQLRGKRVIDVGCGTGILSLMCAKYGLPSQIYAVEASDIVEHTKTIVEKNNLGEIIQVIHGYAEELKLEERVDLIISEWMGTLLLFEMMIESVILTRDNLLKEKGMLWPSTANLFLVPCSAHAQYSQKMEFWDSQFSFDFSPLKPVAQQEFLHKPVHNHEMKPEDCLSSPVSVVFIDMKTVTVAELEHYTHHFSFQIQKDQVMHGFASWFQVTFDPLGHNNDVVILNTGPWHELTHWKQNLFLLDEPISIMQGEIITGSFELYRHEEWRRHLRVLLKFRKVPNEMKENWDTGTELGPTANNVHPDLFVHYVMADQDLHCLQLDPAFKKKNMKNYFMFGDDVYLIGPKN